MQIFVGAFNLQSKVANSPQTVGDARLLFAQPVIVRNANVISPLKERMLPGEQQLIKTLASRLLHTLENELQVNRHWNTQRLVSLDRMDPAQDWSLVVGGTAAEKFPILFRQHKRFGIPTVFLQGGLYIKVAVNADGFLGGILFVGNIFLFFLKIINNEIWMLFLYFEFQQKIANKIRVFCFLHLGNNNSVIQ